MTSDIVRAVGKAHMTADAMRTLVERYGELYNTGELAIADEIIAADFVDHTHPEAPPGPEGVRQAVIQFRAAFPDGRATIQQAICEGDLIAFRFVIQGTHAGTFAGVSPTGKQVTLTGMDFMRVAGGKFAELWSSQDTLDLLFQIGAIAWVGH